MADELKFRRLFQSEIKDSSLSQRDLRSFGRPGVIENVNPEEGLCDIRWLDKPGFRKDVFLTQGTSGEFNIPKKGTVVLCVFDQHDRAFIVRYINLGHESRIKTLKTLPKLKQGEKFWEAGGSYIYMRQNGDIILSTLAQGYMLLENATGTLRTEVVNWRLTTEGGSFYSGVAKRIVTDDGKRVIKTIEKSDGKGFTEFKIQLLETADENLGIDESVTPIVEILLGTKIDDDGNVVNNAGTAELPGQIFNQICAEVNFANGIRIAVDKEGYVSVTGVKQFINNPSVDEVLNNPQKQLIHNPALGTRGQHVAREHDSIVLPVGGAYSSTEHLAQNTNATINTTALINILSRFTAATPGAPLTPLPGDPTLSTLSADLIGVITSGAENSYLGDD